MVCFNELKKRFSQYLRFLKALASDPRVPFLSKALIGLSIAYFLSPIDLIPDFIPILGQLDDLIIVPGLAFIGIKMIPREIYLEHHQRIFSDSSE